MARCAHRCIRPYLIYKPTLCALGWAIWDRRHDRFLNHSDDTWLHPTHAAAIAALDQHLREQAAIWEANA